MGMIDFEKDYAQHFGGLGPARYSQDGKDYDAQGRELDADGNVAEDAPEIVDEPEVQRMDAANKPGVGPADYKLLKQRIGEEEYKKLSGPMKREQILAFKAAQ